MSPLPAPPPPPPCCGTWGLFSTPWAPLCAVGLGGLSPLPGPPSVLWGSCVLALAPWAPLCVSGLVCTFPLSPGPPSASWDLCCSCFLSPACTHCCRAWVFFFWLPRPTLCAVRFVCTAEVCMPPLSQHPGPPFALYVLCALAEFACLATLGHSGLPSVPQGLCALVRFVCCPRELRVRWRGSYASPLSVPRAHCRVGNTVHELLTHWKVQLSLFSAL